MTALYLSSSRREEAPRAIMIAVETTPAWCAYSRVLAQRNAAPAELAVTTLLPRWRPAEERRPEAWALQPGMPLYLVHNGQVRGWAPIVDWESMGRGKHSAPESRDYRLLLRIAPSAWRPVSLWWTFREHFRRGWRYVKWLPETERGHTQWATHNQHVGCWQQ